MAGTTEAGDRMAAVERLLKQNWTMRYVTTTPSGERNRRPWCFYRPGEGEPSATSTSFTGAIDAVIRAMEPAGGKAGTKSTSGSGGAKGAAAAKGAARSKGRATATAGR